jgi:RNA polymerase sigma-70 factor (ECF subfamily)
MKTELAEKSQIEAAQKDPSRFAELYEQHFASIYAFIVSRVRNRIEAQDLTADVFHHALDHLGDYEWRGRPFSSWLFQIAANAIKDYLRKSERSFGAVENLDAAAQAPDQDTERRAMLFQLVNELPADQRKVIALRFADQKSIREIAQQLQRSEGAVKQLQFRALKTLRSQLRNTHG